MRDEIENNPRLLIIVIITAIVAVVIFAIYMLILIWSPIANRNATAQVTAELGSFMLENVTEEAVLNKYCVKILNNLYSGDMKLITEMILPEYLTFMNIDKSGLEAKLKQKGLIANTLQFSSYRTILHPKYGKVFEITLSNATNTYSDKIFIIQKSPNDFKVSFDGFIGLDNTAKSYTVDGLKLDIIEIKEQSTITSIKLKLTNISGHTIILNKGNSYENMYLNLTTGNEIRTNSTWLSGESKELTNGYVINLDLEFLTSDLANGFRKSLVIKDVYDTVSRETKSLEYKIN